MDNKEENKAIFNSHLITYKDIHKDKEAVIMATGNSIKNYIPVIGEDKVFLGLNKIYYYPDLLNISKYYFFGSGYEIEFEHKINVDLISDKIQKFASVYRDGNVTSLGNIYPENAQKINAIPFECGLINFTDNISDYKMLGHSIVFPALQFLLYTGVKKISIVGCDISGFQSDEQQLFEWWNKFREWVKIAYPNVEIVCVNPIGLKGMFKDVYQ